MSDIPWHDELDMRGDNEGPRRWSSDDADEFDWMLIPDPPARDDTPAERHEEPCIVCGVLLWTHGTRDVYCRRCEETGFDW